MTQNRRHFFLMGGAALLLTGCGSVIGPTDAPQIYVLNPAAAPAPAGLGKVNWALAIELPDASDSLDSNRIALARSDTELDYYANATWPDRLPNLVQTAILAGFEAGGRIDSVARARDALHADYSLTSDIRNFEAHYSQSDKDGPTGNPTVRITIVAHMAQAHSRKIVSSLTVTKSVPATANSVDAVVQAFDTALAEAVSDMTAWALVLPPPPSAAPPDSDAPQPPEAPLHDTPRSARPTPQMPPMPRPGQPPPNGP